MDEEKRIPKLGPIDDELAETFAERHRDDLRYDHEGRLWLIRDGDKWRTDRTLEVFDMVRRHCSESKIVIRGMAAMVKSVLSLLRHDRRLALERRDQLRPAGAPH